MSSPPNSDPHSFTESHDFTWNSVSANGGASLVGKLTLELDSTASSKERYEFAKKFLCEVDRVVASIFPDVEVQEVSRK